MEQTKQKYYIKHDNSFAYPTNLLLITVYATYSERMAFKCHKCRLVLYDHFL